MFVPTEITRDSDTKVGMRILYEQKTGDFDPHVGETVERPSGDRRPPMFFSSEIRGKPGSSEADDEESL